MPQPLTALTNVSILHKIICKSVRPAKKIGEMNKYDIKARIEEKGSTLSAIARDAGLHSSACRQALRYPVPAANHAIARFLGKEVHELWPRWFDQKGRRLPNVSTSRTSLGGVSSQNRGRF